MIHELKTLPQYFEDVVSGRKNFEIRYNDRGFSEKDLLALNEFDGEKYTGRSCLVYIDYILDNPTYCKNGMVSMAIKPCSVTRDLGPSLSSKTEYFVPIATDIKEKPWGLYEELVQALESIDRTIDDIEVVNYKKHQVNIDDFISALRSHNPNNRTEERRLRRYRISGSDFSVVNVYFPNKEGPSDQYFAFATSERFKPLPFENIFEEIKKDW